MSAPQVLSLVLLVACLVLAVWRRINIGVLALASCAVLLVASGASATKMYTAFPASVFTLIAGVSLLFAHLEKSGALHAFVGAVFRRIGTRTALLPWACFLIAAAMSTMGAFATAPIALLVPAVAFVSTRYPRTFLVNEMAVVIGANSAGLSPLNPTGATVSAALAKAGAHYSTWGLWGISIAVAVVAVACVQALEAFRSRRGGRYLAPMDSEAVTSTTDYAGHTGVSATPLNRPYAICSGIALGAFVVAIIAFGLDVGVTAMLAALILQVLFRPNEKELIHRIPWNAILLLCGLLTFLGLIQQIGTMDAIQKDLTQIATPALLVLVLAYLTAFLCNIESSTLGVLTLMSPIVGSSLGHSPAVLLIVAAVAAPAALTVMNPVHVAGTLVIANTVEEQQETAFGRLFGLSVGLSLIAPGILALIAIAAMG